LSTVCRFFYDDPSFCGILHRRPICGADNVTELLLTNAKTLAEGVHTAIRADILACRLAPGAKIKINDLCERFEVSISAVREALSRLSAQGLVVAEAQRGFRVAPVSIEELADLTAARIDIETLCLGRAIARGEIEWETNIVAALHRLSRTPYVVSNDKARVDDTWENAHRVFHEALVAGCDNTWLLRLRMILYEQSERYRRLSVPLGPQNRDIKSEHEQIAAAMLARDTESAVALMIKHMKTTTGIVINAMQRGDRPTVTNS
jgi:DNA-binding GntR family transcriptional regulator